MPHFFASYYPYLGAVPGEIVCTDVANLPANAQVVRITKPYKNMAQLVRFPRIRQLELTQLEPEWMEYLQQLPNLEHLRLSYCKKQESLPSLSALQSLRVLMLLRCRQLISLDCLYGLPQLQALCLSELPRISGLSPVGSIASLQELWLDGILQESGVNFDGLEAFQNLTNLQSLHYFLAIRKETKSLAPLHSLSKLTHLKLVDRYPEREYRQLLAQLPQLSQISFNGGNAFWIRTD